MSRIVCNYTSHFVEMAQKYREEVDLKGNDLSDLIDFLNGRYKGFKNELIDADSLELSTRNGILIRRGEENTGSILRLDTEIRDGDILTFF